MRTVELEKVCREAQERADYWRQQAEAHDYTHGRKLFEMAASQFQHFADAMRAMIGEGA